MNASIGLYVMSALYFFAGWMHFYKPQFYKKIIPPFFKNKDLVNQLSGVAEIVLALGLLTPYRGVFALGVIVLLMLVFPANIYHLQQKGAGMNIPIWVLWLRLPLQFVLVWWAYQYV